MISRLWSLTALKSVKGSDLCTHLRKINKENRQKLRKCNISLISEVHLSWTIIKFGMWDRSIGLINCAQGFLVCIPRIFVQ